MDMQNDISSWISGIPKITKWWFFSFFFVPLTTRLNVLDPYIMILTVKAISNFQVWRLVTGLLWYPVNFRWLMMLYFLYNYSTRLETGYFNGRPADYVFMLLFNAVCMDIVGIIMGFYVVSTALIFSVLYVWCQINQEAIVTFWFGLQVKAIYFPWVLFFFFFILGDSWQTMLLGILVGHLYFFLTMKYPQEFGGRHFLTTPQFLYNLFPGDQRASGFGVPPASRRTERGGDGMRGHDWGRGQRLD